MLINKKIIIIGSAALVIIFTTVVVFTSILNSDNIRQNINSNTINSGKSSDSSQTTNSSTSAATTETSHASDSISTIPTIAPNDSPKEKFAKSIISTKTPNQSEEVKFDAINFGNRAFSPIYNPKISFSSESGYNTDGTVKYSSGPYKLVSYTDSVHTFKFSVPNDVKSSASKVIWEVSFVPFNGSPITSKSVKPKTVLLSGELSVNSSQFNIDFKKVKTTYDNLLKPKSYALIKPIKPIVIKPTTLSSINSFIDKISSEKESFPSAYYVRIYPVDSKGNSLGDAGSGTPVIYGSPLKSKTQLLQIITKKFSLMPARQSGTPNYQGEFPNDFFNVNEVAMLNKSSRLYSVLPSGFSTKTQELIVQASVVDLTGTDWQNTPGQVYEKSYFPSDSIYKDLDNKFTLGIEIDFSKFVPADNLLPVNEKIPYYVRVVSLTQGTDPGTVKAEFSETVKINYGVDTSNVKIYEQIKITPNIPQITKVTYEPIRWEATNWQYHYKVIRQPTFKEAFGAMFSNEPFTPFSVGTKLDFTPQPEKDQSWWEDAWDAISDFFGDLVGFVADIANWVSSTYNNLKSGLIKMVVANLPLIPDEFRGYLETAITAMVDYGLASIGIPPTLPNFDELSGMGVDYLAAVAMEQAGIPADELATRGVAALADGIETSMKSSTNTSSPNPMNWNFIKMDSDYLYKPAYLLIDLYNPSSETTPSGVLHFSADKFMDMKLNGSDSSVTRIYAAYDSSYISLFKPVYGLKIPAIGPGQRLTVPVFLENHIGSPFYSGGPKVQDNDYKIMFYNLGEYDFSFSILYDLPLIWQEAKKQGHTKDAIYSYSTLGNGASFKIEPSDGYVK